MPIDFRPRVSSAPPYDVPRWEPEPDAPDFSQFERQDQIEQLTLRKLGLPALGLGLRLGSSPPPTYEATSEATTPPPELTSGRQGKRTSGGTGLGAYGLGTLNAGAINGYRNKSNPYGIHQNLYQALGLLNAQMQKAGLGTFSVTDGWRSYAGQVSAKRRKGNLAATPGRSVHGIGAAVDVAATRRQKEWLRQNAPTYGVYFPFFEKEDWHMQLDPRLF